MGRDIETDPDADADWDADADADQYGCWPNEWQRWRIRNTVPKGSPDPNAQKSRQGLHTNWLKLSSNALQFFGRFRFLARLVEPLMVMYHVQNPKFHVECPMSWQQSLEPLMCAIVWASAPFSIPLFLEGICFSNTY